ncbi:chitin binding Peritrophin-A domain-containing protein Gasp [Oratosquilla oratoria]|uniref:chitin binding Peritrophin-A domain-containing protein Gasp n=1 Tax=Oratosquilla oratoria TaxID=337810 RepID=UPI003F7622E9
MKTVVSFLVLAVAATGLAQDYFDYVCPEEDGFYPHETKCDAYWSCKDGQAEYKLCGNGLAFDDSNPDREHCNYLFSVNCGNRTELEPAISTTNCPFLYGIFPTDDDCSVFYSCWDGEASRYQCAPGLAYDRHSRICTWIDKVDECSSQRAATQQGFDCPAPGELAVTGSFSRHAHPEDCRQYYVCLDGVAREYGCPIGTVFQIGDSDGFGKCIEPTNVPGCEDYYGDLDLEALRKSKLVLGNVGHEAATGGHSHTARRPAAPAPVAAVPAEEIIEDSQ